MRRNHWNYVFLKLEQKGSHKYTYVIVISRETLLTECGSYRVLKDRIICSECSEEGHKWSECKSQTKRCINCRGTHRTLAMSCPVKRDVINRIKENKQREEREKK